MVERVIRTLKSRLYKLFSLCGQYEWFKKNLNEVVQSYNNTRHKISQFKPIDVNKTNQILVRLNIIKSRKKKKYTKLKFNVGDNVRISKYKGNFYKGYTSNWSIEIFIVSQVNKTNPPTYILEDRNKQKILGSFYEYELQKTKFPDIYLIEKVLKKKGNKLFVKWLGLNSKPRT